eukprot:911302-Prymnesium_polylepis.1
MRSVSMSMSMSMCGVWRKDAPCGGAMRTEAHKSVGSVRQTVGVLSVRLIDVISMLTCVRTGFYGRTVPSAEGTLESSSAAVRSVKRRRATKPSSRTV